MKKIQEWIRQRTEKFRLWLYWKNLTLKDLFMICFSFLWLLGFVVFTSFALMSCAPMSEDTAYREASEDDEFVNNWWTLETDNVLLEQLAKEGNCYKFYELDYEEGTFRELFGYDPQSTSGIYFVADWERTGEDSMLISDKYELYYDKKETECYLLQAYSAVMSAEGVACPCDPFSYRG